MKRISLLTLVFIYNLAYTQINFQSHVITDIADGAQSIFTIDIDGDGDMDVLSASFLDDDSKIAWYENTDGLGNFGTQQIIEENESGANSVFAADIDGDGDMDIIAAFSQSDKVIWYENTNGLGNFGTQQIIGTNEDGATSVYATDIDGDGDIDVLLAAYNDDHVVWYENTNGLGNFGTQQIIGTNADNAQSVYATDIDNDGDMDVLLASSLDDTVAWYENTDGLGNFGTQQIITTNVDFPSKVYATDIDNDGDMDILSASALDNKIAWYENTDGLGSFGTQQIITTTTDFEFSVYAVDMDGDGDIDVLSASYNNDKLAWYENTDGLGNFGTQQIITTNGDGITSVYATDIDGDGDMDVLSTSFNEGKIIWHENLGTPLEVNENNRLDFSIFPIPTKNNIDIKSETNIIKIEIYDKIGQLVFTNSSQHNINISSLNKGIYFCKVKDEHGNYGVKKVIKK